MSEQAALVLKASEFRDLVAAVIPFAANDAGLPVLNTVLIETKGTYVTATATDRLRMGVRRLRYADAPPPFRALVSLKALRRLLVTFKPTRYDDPVLSFAMSEKGMVTVTQEGSLDGFVGTQVSVDLVDGDYPKITKILTEGLALGSSDAPMTFNASHLADFKHVVQRGDHVTMRSGFSAVKPTIVTIGDYFIGAVMPRRFSGAEQSHADWAKFLAPVEPEAVAS